MPEMPAQGVYPAAKALYDATAARPKTTAADYAQAAATMAQAADHVTPAAFGAVAASLRANAGSAATVYAQVSLALDAAERRAEQTTAVEEAQRAVDHAREEAAQRPTWDEVRATTERSAVDIFVLVAWPDDDSGRHASTEWDADLARMLPLYEQWAGTAMPRTTVALYHTRTATQWTHEQVTAWVQERYPYGGGGSSLGTLLRSHTEPAPAGAR